MVTPQMAEQPSLLAPELRLCTFEGQVLATVEHVA